MKWVLIKIMYSEIKNLPTIQETLKKNKVKINKALGQNFLFDLNLTDKIVKQSKPLASTIIEIGSGPGSLTRSILKNKSATVFAIDKDIQSEKMLSELKIIYKDRLNIIIDDALHYPIWNLGKAPRQVIANLPYNCSIVCSFLIFSFFICFVLFLKSGSTASTVIASATTSCKT